MNKILSLMVITLSVLLTGCKGDTEAFLGNWVQDKPGNSNLIIEENKDHDLKLTAIHYYSGVPMKDNSVAEVKTDSKAVVIGGVISQTLTINSDGSLSYDGKTYHKK